MKREYKIIEFTDDVNKINELGELGWELVVGFHYQTNLYLGNYLVFKRPKK